LDNITSIYLDLNVRNGSKRLEGIELLKNLCSLSISGFYVGHPIAESTYLDGIDFSPLNSMGNLERLHISYAKFTTIPDFGGIPSLKHLSFRNCEIKSMSRIENAKQIRSLSIDFLYLIPENLSLIFELTNLNYLKIEGGTLPDHVKILSMSGISKMTELKELRIERNIILPIDLDELKNLSQLESLSLVNMLVSDFQFIAGLKNLHYFGFHRIHDSVTSFDFLSSLVNLSFLEMSGNGNTIDITHIRNMTKLEKIWLNNFSITNFHILDNLPELKNVFVEGSKFYPENNNRLKYAEVVYEYIYNDR
jgi:Leucine-rich repeat (LRR) protein